MILRHKLRTANWTLFIGAVFVAFVIVLSIFGPALAPQDPMQENYTLEVDGSIQAPPYPAFKIPGFPFGTDRFGRDLLSRILWGVRPTMIMVTTVAAFRLVMGILLGLIIGWAEGRRARWLDSILSSLLSVPVLIVALIGIYTVGVEKGLWAFIIGLGITGWAETARMVSEQTRLVKRQTFVEAARALGAGERVILFNHILRQILSLVWVLLAFEISSTLLVAASLGFLDIYIGGGVWIEISDFVAVNVAGLPELGQMLSIALVRITDPSALLIIGSVIFMGVLGFNLLGEGLRIELSQREFGRSAGMVPQQAQEWLVEHVLIPLRAWWEISGRKAAFYAILFVLVAGGWIYYDRNRYQFEQTQITLESPGGNLWATELHDSYGTQYVPTSLTTQPTLKWEVQIPGGASGGPAVMANGTIVIAGLDNVLLAFTPGGDMLWKAPLPEVPIGTPALDGQGNIYIADFEGYLSAFDSQGGLLWRVEASSTRQATSGPIVSTSGMIYVTIIDAVAGVSPEGTLVWRRTAANVYVESPPRLNADESLVFLRDVALDAGTGQIQEIPILPEHQVLFTEPAFFTGVDGKDYYRSGHEVMQWRRDESGLQVGPARGWEAGAFVRFNPFTQGMSSNGLAWLFYTSGYGDGRLVWLDGQGRLVGNFEFPFSNSRLIAIGQESEGYMCGPTGARIKCMMAFPGSGGAEWEITIDDNSQPVGGALVPGAFYVASADGILYALSPEEAIAQP